MEQTKTLFFDMDGTLARFYEHRNTCLERMYEKGFFAGLKPYKLAAELNEFGDKYDCWDKIYIVSACVSTDYCFAEKLAWLRQHLPHLQEDHIILCAVGSNKAEVVELFCGKGGEKWLVDDYGANIRDWEQHGKDFSAIKFINGINNKKGNYYKYKARTMERIAAISNILVD